MFFFFNEPAPPEIHTHAPSLPLHDSLPISLGHFPSPSRRHSCVSAFPARANLFDRPRATMLVVSIHRALARAKQIPPGCRRPDGFGLDSQAIGTALLTILLAVGEVETAIVCDSFAYSGP